MTKIEDPSPIVSFPFDVKAMQALASVIDAVGSNQFPNALRQFICSVCNFESMIVTRYPLNGPPESLFQDLDDVQAAISVQFYATGPYLLDPLYLACRAGCEPGVYRTLDLAPEAFYRSEYFRTFYRNIKISDEVGLLIPETGNGWINLSLARLSRHVRFTPQELDKLKHLFPILSALVLKNWGISESKDQTTTAPLLEDRLETFGMDILSPREAEIIRLILQGHSTPSAAAYLEISQGTVKVHRHNAYSKLGISSQAELFSMATRYFMTPPS